MTISTILYCFTFLNTSALLFLAIYIIMTLSDLDCDHLNPTQCSSKLTKWMIPEVISFAINVFIIALANRWFLLAINLPMLAYVVHKFFLALPHGSLGFYDPAELHHRDTLTKHIKLAFVRIIFYLIHLFIFLYLFIISFLTRT